MLQNIIAGLQGIIDHAMVGHFVGYTANAAIGVSWQIILVVIVFISSTFTGMAVLVARFAGANQPDKVNRVVYQAFLTAFALAVVLAAIGYAASPSLLTLVNAAPDVRAEALPFLRAMFLGVFGMLMFFMLSGAFRAAGDPQTPLRLGVIMTVLTIVFNVILIPIFGTLGAALGTISSSTTVTIYGIWRITRPDSVVHFEKGMSRAPDFTIIRSLFKFGLPAGVQGIAMNVGGVLLLLYLSVSGLFITVALSYTGGLQGTGDTRSPLFISIISQVIIPLGLCTLFQAMYGLDPAHIWTAIVVGHATRATLSVLRFKQGKWRSIAVDIEPARP